MVKVVANDYVKAECVDEFLKLAKEIVEKTNANDPGCIKYELYRDNSDPTHFAMIEEWETQAALDAHMKTPHFHRLGEETGALVAGPMDVRIYEAEKKN